MRKKKTRRGWVSLMLLAHKIVLFCECTFKKKKSLTSTRNSRGVGVGVGVRRGAIFRRSVAFRARVHLHVAARYHYLLNDMFRMLCFGYVMLCYV